MKKRGRKLTEEERIEGRAAIRREAERIERRKLNAKRLLVQRSAKGALYIGKIHPTWDKPRTARTARTVAKGLAQELFDFPSSGAREVAFVIERYGGDQRFLGQMLIALGEYLLDGRQMFDDLDVEIADIARHMGRCPTIPELIRELQKRRPNLSVDDKFRDKIKKRVRRWLKPIPREYLEPPL
jgi:hypothetical protein